METFRGFNVVTFHLEVSCHVAVIFHGVLQVKVGLAKYTRERYIAALSQSGVIVQRLHLTAVPHVGKWGRQGFCALLKVIWNTNT